MNGFGGTGYYGQCSQTNCKTELSESQAVRRRPRQIATVAEGDNASLAGGSYLFQERNIARVMLPGQLAKTTSVKE